MSPFLGCYLFVAIQDGDVKRDGHIDFSEFLQLLHQEGTVLMHEVAPEEGNPEFLSRRHTVAFQESPRYRTSPRRAARSNSLPVEPHLQQARGEGNGTAAIAGAAVAAAAAGAGAIAAGGVAAGAILEREDEDEEQDRGSSGNDSHHPPSFLDETSDSLRMTDFEGGASVLDSFDHMEGGPRSRNGDTEDGDDGDEESEWPATPKLEEVEGGLSSDAGSSRPHRRRGDSMHGLEELALRNRINGRGKAAKQQKNGDNSDYKAPDHVSQAETTDNGGVAMDNRE